MRNWEEIKLDGSDHYKGHEVEVIDLLRHIQPEPSLSVVEIKALADIIKYAYRCLTRGIKESDLNKIIHYSEIAGAATEKAG
jgi:hypothetical protein